MRIDSTGVIVECPACRRSNRLPFTALGKTIRCGQCKSPVAAPAVPVDIADTASFDAAANSSALPLVVDFWAPWCAPCRMVAPELEKLARETSGRYLVVKVNTDQLTEVAARYRISSIPTLAVVYRGREIDRMSGARSARDILAFVQQSLANDERRAS